MDRNFEQEYKKAFEAAKGLHDAGNSLTKKQMEIVFPQLAESEDERIRKALIEVFKEKLERGFEWVEYGIPNRSVLSWLEKQKEQKQYDDDPFNNPRFLDGFDVGRKVQKIFDEQKPAEWSEEDRLHYANVLEALEYVKGCKSDYDKIEAVKSDIAWLKLLRNRVGKDSLQPHWKPTEEQMKALRLARSFVVDDFGEKPTLSETLKELEEQLKKLR